MTSLDVVIVNWNTGGLLRDCLRSLAEAARGIDLRRVVVVDNASSDGSADGLEGLGLPLRRIRNETNRGFGAACNQGAAESTADLLLFLNPDARLLADTLSKTVGFLDRGAARDVGILGAQLVDDGGLPLRTSSRFPTVPRLCWTSLGLDRIAPRLFPGLRMRTWDHRESRRVDQVMGAFFLVRTDLFRRLEGFDERFFLYFEDVDLALRAARAGWRSYFLAEARVHHLGGGSSRQIPARRLFLSLQSRLLFARKHLGGWRYRTVAACALVCEPVTRTLGGLLRRAPGEVAATFGAYRMLLRERPARVARGR